MIEAFNLGLLDSSNAGLTLRAFLSKRLNCDPMRISKKFTGVDCTGKRTYKEGDQTNAEAIRAELAELEKLFNQKMEQINLAHSKSKQSPSALEFDHIVSTPAIDAMILKTGLNSSNNSKSKIGEMKGSGIPPNFKSLQSLSDNPYFNKGLYYQQKNCNNPMEHDPDNCDCMVPAPVDGQEDYVPSPHSSYSSTMSRSRSVSMGSHSLQSQHIYNPHALKVPPTVMPYPMASSYDDMWYDPARSIPYSRYGAEAHCTATYPPVPYMNYDYDPSMSAPLPPAGYGRGRYYPASGPSSVDDMSNEVVSRSIDHGGNIWPSSSSLASKSNNAGSSSVYNSNHHNVMKRRFDHNENASMDDDNLVDQNSDTVDTDNEYAPTGTLAPSFEIPLNKISSSNKEDWREKEELMNDMNGGKKGRKRMLRNEENHHPHEDKTVEDQHRNVKKEKFNNIDNQHQHQSNIEVEEDVSREQYPTHNESIILNNNNNIMESHCTLTNHNKSTDNEGTGNGEDTEDVARSLLGFFSQCKSANSHNDLVEFVQEATLKKSMSHHDNMTEIDYLQLASTSNSNNNHTSTSTSTTMNPMNNTHIQKYSSSNNMNNNNIIMKNNNEKTTSRKKSNSISSDNNMNNNFYSYAPPSIATSGNAYYSEKFNMPNIKSNSVGISIGGCGFWPPASGVDPRNAAGGGIESLPFPPHNPFYVPCGGGDVGGNPDTTENMQVEFARQMKMQQQRWATLSMQHQAYLRQQQHYSTFMKDEPVFLGDRAEEDYHKMMHGGGNRRGGYSRKNIHRDGDESGVDPSFTNNLSEKKDMKEVSNADMNKTAASSLSR